MNYPEIQEKQEIKRKKEEHRGYNKLQFNFWGDKRGIRGVRGVSLTDYDGMCICRRLAA